MFAFAHLWALCPFIVKLNWKSCLNFTKLDYGEMYTHIIFSRCVFCWDHDIERFYSHYARGGLDWQDLDVTEQQQGGRWGRSFTAHLCIEHIIMWLCKCRTNDIVMWFWEICYLFIYLFLSWLYSSSLDLNHRQHIQLLMEPVFTRQLGSRGFFYLFFFLFFKQLTVNYVLKLCS